MVLYAGDGGGGGGVVVLSTGRWVQAGHMIADSKKLG